ncbi:MAG: esterase family protein [Candidatus Marinimicrobia bacterium]|nr:esterase family protein [Candidatus Neomarinimicrobiota bacterium]
MKVMKFLAISMLLIYQLYSASLDSVVIKSKAMGSKPKAVVVVPDSYHQTKNHFPVLYLLHGWSGSYKDWSGHMDLRPLSDKYQIIIICPDGGYAGWYVDSPMKKDNQYETYISNEVVRYTDKHYRTEPNADGRFICGLSMGGHGAISLLAKHPDLYTAAGSMSGVMVLNASGNKYGISQLIGPPEDNGNNWKNYSCVYLIENLVGLEKGIIIDCGIDDFLIDTNREMHSRLMELSIPHDYYERPGSHSWDYWSNALEYHLLYFKNFRQSE